jgi:hypothetical protein
MQKAGNHWCTVIKREGYVEPMEEMKNAYKILVGKPEGTRTLGRIKPHWTTMLNWMDRIHLAQNRIQKQYPVNAVMNLWIRTRGGRIIFWLDGLWPPQEGLCSLNLVVHNYYCVNKQHGLGLFLLSVHLPTIQNFLVLSLVIIDDME